jgi:hypothetical protein
VIHALQDPAKYLCLDRFSMVRAKTSGQDLWEADFVVTGLIVERDKPLRAPKVEE